MAGIQADRVRVTTSRPVARNISRYVSSALRTILLAIFWLLTFLMNGDVKPVVIRGFFCGDSSINYPYKPDTIDLKTLFLTSLILPGILIHFCDKRFQRLTNQFANQPNHLSSDISLRRRKTSDARRADSNHDENGDYESSEDLRTKDTRDDKETRSMKGEREVRSVEETDSDQSEDDDEEVSLFSRIASDEVQSNRKRNISQKLTVIHQRSYSEFQAFLFGFCTTMLLTGVGKITGGRLRPHFLQRCQPNVDCTDMSKSHMYLEDFNCTNVQLKSRDMSYIRTSWPSGHASIIFYSMFYLILFLNDVIPSLTKLSPTIRRFRLNPLLMYAIYVGLVGFAGFTAMTRVSDYHHHPTDVLGGSILGTLVALVLSKTLARQYSQEIQFLTR